jgi:Flp pilus assembly protein protease CpaA
MQYLWYFYPSIIVLGVFASYTDIRYHLIRNRHLLIACAYGVTIYSCFWFYGQPIPFFRFILINLLVSFVIAYFLYLRDIWSSGDAKLFITLSLLTPSYRYLSLFKLPAITLFVNTAIISFFFMLILGLKYFITDIRYLPKDLLKGRFEHFFYALATVFSISWIFWYVLSPFKLLDPLFLTAFIYFGYTYLFRFLSIIKSRKWLFLYLLIAGLLIRAWVQPQFFYSLERLRFYFISTLKYTVFFSVIDVIFLFQRGKFKRKQALNESHTAMAPLMVIGAFAMESQLIPYVLQALALLRR